MSDELAVELIGIEKRFPGVIANHDVNIAVRRGTIHAIVGENGAGKSTLMKTLYGMHRPEAGRVVVEGTEQHFRSPSDAIDVGIGCGVEAMSRVPLGTAARAIEGRSPRVPESPYEHITQFEAAERIANLRGTTRDQVDAIGLRSQQNAARAQAEGRFDREIVPVEAPVVGSDGPTGETRQVTKDQGPRASTLEGLAGLKPVREGGYITAGNASQLSDGASAAVVMEASVAEKRGLEPLGYYRATAVAGLEPDDGFEDRIAAGVRERLQVYKDVGVTHFSINPVGENPLEIIEKVKAWID